MQNPKLILGTHNPKKRLELTDLLKDLPLQILDLCSYSEVKEIEETETTFAANADLKASAYAKATKEWTLAEDSGLVVPALKGAPGIYSARYSGVHGDHAANNRKIVEEIKLLGLTDCPAYYVCAASLADPEGSIRARSEGRCHGRIILTPRGNEGFGYDPLFLIPEYHRTFAELSLSVKQALSHRGKAIHGLRSALWQIARHSEK